MLKIYGKNPSIVSLMKNSTLLRKATVFKSSISTVRNDAFRMDTFSNWYKAKRAIANCILFKKKLQSKLKKTNCLSQVNYDLMQETEIAIVKSVQVEHFEEEIRTLRQLQEAEISNLDHEKTRHKSKALQKVSSLYRFNIFLDKSGVLRVGSRLNMSNLKDSQWHPTVIPKKSHVTNLEID